MNSRARLAPSNATPFEVSLDLTGASIDGIPVDIAKIIDPWAASSSLLPWIAWGLSADLWASEWPEEKRRFVTSKSLVWHYKKGTANLLRKYVEVIGGRVTRIEVPPSKTFLMPAYTEEERLAFLRRFPELRLYPYVARGFYRFANFTNLAYGREKSFLGKVYVHDVRAWSRYLRTAELRDRDQITPLTYRVIQNQYIGSEMVSSFEEVILPARRSDKLFPNTAPKARVFFGTVGYIGERLVRIKRDIALPYTAPRELYNTVQPSENFINVAPDKIFERHAGQCGSIYPAKGNFLSRTYLPKSIAWRYVFERWYIFEADRLPDQRTRSKHIGYTRLGLPAYYAEAKVSMPGMARPREAWRFVNGFLRQHSTDSVDRARKAVTQSKALRDKILINTKTRRQSRVGDRIKLGDYKVGQFIKF